jgi:hypothetical protein
MLRRERPKLLIDRNGEPTHLFSGAIAPCNYKSGDLGCSPHGTARSGTPLAIRTPRNRSWGPKIFTIVYNYHCYIITMLYNTILSYSKLWGPKNVPGA